jgi:DNA-binding MarR family transcriptional regulator
MELSHQSDFNKTIAPWLGFTFKLFSNYISEVLKAHSFDITKEQWIVLKILNEESNGIIQNKLAFITNRNKTSLTRLINGMEKKGLVIRVTCDKDSRKKFVFMTEKGKHQFLKFKPILLEKINTIQSCLSNDEFKQLTHIMSKLQTEIKQQQSN